MEVVGNSGNAELVVKISTHEIAGAMDVNAKLDLLKTLATDEEVLTALIDLLEGRWAFDEDGKGWCPSTDFVDALRLRVLEHLDAIRIEAVRRALQDAEQRRCQLGDVSAWAWSLFNYHRSRRDGCATLPNPKPSRYDWRTMTQEDAIAFLGPEPTKEAANG